MPSKMYYRRENIRIFDENDVDVTPLPLTFTGFEDDGKEEAEAAIVDTFQDIEQVPAPY